MSFVSNVRVSHDDYKRLEPRQWLNDSIVNFWLDHIKSNRMTDDFRQMVHVFNTMFYSRYVSSGYQHIRDWTKVHELFDKTYVLIPIHVGAHWKLVIVYFQNSTPLDYGMIMIFDSLSSRTENDDECVNNIYKYLNEEWDRHNPNQVRDFSAITMPSVRLRVPQQDNGHDCGVFMCEFVEKFVEFEPHFRYCLTTSKEMDDFTSWFDQSYIPYKRMMMKIVINDVFNFERVRINDRQLEQHHKTKDCVMCARLGLADCSCVMMGRAERSSRPSKWRQPGNRSSSVSAKQQKVLRQPINFVFG